MYIFNHCR